jgi:hypothetical protein
MGESKGNCKKGDKRRLVWPGLERVKVKMLDIKSIFYKFGTPERL